MAQTNGQKPLSAVQKLRIMLSDPEKFVVCPGVYDGYTARIALAEGAECLYMTGAGTTMSRLGMPDMGLAQMSDMLTNASMLASISPRTPLIADADTGYGSALMVARTVSSYIRAGVAGLHLEDQVVTKRCGHLRGKQLVDTEEFVSRIRAAVMAREQSGGDIVIIARTDALAGEGYDEALKRLRAAIAAGAEVAFLEGVTTREEASNLTRDLAPTPCLFNNVPGGVSPDFSVKEAREIGYKLAIFPTLALEVVYPAVRKACRELLDEGSVKSVEEDGRRWGPRELFNVCGLDELMEFDRKAGGKGYAEDA
ncbi:carboxyvinyl-carboxyphosphonate phosphorylmutase [Karstenula rhodostoma CBS 690.94]|uniref:Carboxyvinyl-carboxyphosphonate phosphorylmutase n=1 Tax=Karstenula rhodostoma CBS 690.94 TaxID=1392251 RepID=A0A9P4PXQ0_9PLEO|nr:carboxyvinyl-carboxyphosphonate phosphorylmutase [Karstenula rhodostoma CBS 690.94]